ncbi:OLC1v1034340C3 [Oldenlandia corymbosa var. corymbosa]|uniref:glucomannan 4-beta-mannosyltransferase n=1 Tax=Oldenlandia corymbosa var. corymbosa TaxID=529605 RepID=A0AAV1CT72_OLDCO|nr:OLC1v1034340C3 [Oldenlandia corymbosa var. corymbosa]
MDRNAITNFVLQYALLDYTEEFSKISAHILAGFIVPVFKAGIILGLVLSTMLLVEMLGMGLVLLVVKLFGKKPEQRYKWEPLKDDVEMGSSAYPMVLVQIPMFNEKEVYQLSIGAACCLSWPSDRIIIQVLDDSTDPIIKASVEIECRKWAGQGVNIMYETRDNRNGYKAGALKEGMKHPYVSQCDYVAIFDADFQPEPDFLRQTVPYLVHNPQLGLVQASMEFVNSNECLLTRMQEMSLNYHFTVEQEVGSSTYAFFSFNGTAGVWRSAAIHEAGGWQDRTTVEDMDLAVRACLKGWRFLYLSSIKVKNELPSTLKAYRIQQHRWTCGPANLFRKMIMEILRTEKFALWKKIHVIYSFFWVRKIIAHVVTFIFYVVVLPATVFVPEVQVPTWGTAYIQAYTFYVVLFLIAFGTPRSLHLIALWMLFENAMSLHRAKAIFIGLFEWRGAKEWVVTEKLGNALKIRSAGKEPNQSRLRIRERLHPFELAVGAYLFCCGCYDVAFGKNLYYLYLFAQAAAFCTVGLGYIGTSVPNS